MDSNSSEDSRAAARGESLRPSEDSLSSLEAYPMPRPNLYPQQPFIESIMQGPDSYLQLTDVSVYPPETQGTFFVIKYF